MSIAIRLHLAMTAAELGSQSPLPRHPAWMACHFSPYSTGLTNLPLKLPKQTLLILNDRTPIHGHDPERVCRELNDVLNRFQCPGLLVDFQNKPCRESAELVSYLAEHVQAPLALPPEFDRGKAVFLPPVPTDVRAEVYLQAWAGREIWLEAALEGQDLSLTAEGISVRPNRRFQFDHVHEDTALHCHYSILDTPEGFLFHTWRTPEDLAGLLAEAEGLGVRTGVGLYQELGSWEAPVTSPSAPAPRPSSTANNPEAIPSAPG